MKIEVAAVQMQSLLGEKVKNCERMIREIERIKQTWPNVSLIVFPECAVTGYECPELFPELAEPWPGGESIARLAKAACAHRVHLIFGFVEAGEDCVYNSAALIDEAGKAIGRYRKVHLVEGMETESFATGDSFPVFETKIGKIGMMICWDSVFPETARLLTLHGAELIVVPEAVECGIEQPWQLALAARALDNGVYLLSCNHAGTDRTLEYFGQSSLFSPLGEQEAGLGKENGTLYGTVNYDAVKDIREYFYMLRQRRPSLYKDLCRQNILPSFSHHE